MPEQWYTVLIATLLIGTLNIMELILNRLLPGKGDMAKLSYELATAIGATMMNDELHRVGSALMGALLSKQLGHAMKINRRKTSLLRLSEVLDSSKQTKQYIDIVTEAGLASFISVTIDLVYQMIYKRQHIIKILREQIMKLVGDIN